MATYLHPHWSLTPFEELFGGVWPRSADSGYRPAVNLWSDSEAVHVEVELPGVSEKDIEINVLGDELSIKGERPEVVQEGAHAHRRERPFGPFERVLSLPVTVDAARVNAVLKNGILFVTLPRSEATKPRRITVKAQH